MLIRYEPFREFRLSSEAGAPAQQPMPLDVYRRGDTFFIHVDVPGIDPDRVELFVEHDTLTIKAGGVSGSVKTTTRSSQSSGRTASSFAT